MVSEKRNPGPRLLFALYCSFGHQAARPPPESPHHMIREPSGLGVKVVLVTGVQNQIDATMRERNMLPRYVGGYRITDREAMKIAIECAGEIRIECEQNLSKVCFPCCVYLHPPDDCMTVCTA